MALSDNFIRVCLTPYWLFVPPAERNSVDCELVHLRGLRGHRHSASQALS